MCKILTSFSFVRNENIYTHVLQIYHYNTFWKHHHENVFCSNCIIEMLWETDAFKYLSIDAKSIMQQLYPNCLLILKNCFWSSCFWILSYVPHPKPLRFSLQLHSSLNNYHIFSKDLVDKSSPVFLYVILDLNRMKKLLFAVLSTS